MLEAFRLVLGLNVNADKSLIYPITLPASLEGVIKKKYPFRWVTDSWRYLGVQIPLDFSRFSRLNLEKVNEMVHDTLKLWDKTMLSWFDQLQLMKTIVVPKFLFLFRMAPLGITDKLLRKWQRTLLDFVWQYKKPKLSKELMCLPKQRGGLSFPDLEVYFHAALLTTFMKRYSALFSTPWKDIMNNALLPYDFKGVA